MEEEYFDSDIIALVAKNTENERSSLPEVDIQDLIDIINDQSKNSGDIQDNIDIIKRDYRDNDRSKNYEDIQDLIDIINEDNRDNDRSKKSACNSEVDVDSDDSAFDDIDEFSDNESIDG